MTGKFHLVISLISEMRIGISYLINDVILMIINKRANTPILFGGNKVTNFDSFYDVMHHVGNFICHRGI